MRWYKHLYVGKKAKKHRFSIIQNIRKNHLQPGVFIITPASNEHNILDIYPAVTLMQPYYQQEDLLILGIADGYGEALEVAGQIVDEMYQKTGAFCLDGFIKEAVKV